jgi:hypothetical protein
MPGEDDMRTSFQTARQEIITRMTLRDQLIMAFLAGSTAITGGAIAYAKPMVALMVPFFGLASSIVVGQHTSAIHSICCWTRRMVAFQHWGRSVELRNMHNSSIHTRAYAQMLIFIPPSLAALLFSARDAFAEASMLLSGLFWTGVLCTILSIYTQRRVLSFVRELNRTTGYEKEKPS